MITRVDASVVSEWKPQTEASIRQCGQFAVYGDQWHFLRFYQDDIGNRLSVMENTAVLDAVGDTEEMRLFLTMDPDISYVRTDKMTAQILAESWNTTYKSEAVMEAPPKCDVSPLVSEIPPKDIYPVLCEGFSEGIPPFESWYADVHHRYRRGLCRCVGVYDENRVVVCAMTVAQCDTAALIGAVATLPDARGKGYASACVLSLASKMQQQGKRVLLSPKNAYAHRLYEKIGFVTVGEWGSVEKVSY